MALAVIGAGFGRTGTMSLKIALEMLGFGPCYHMVEVLRAPAAAEYWAAAAEGQKVDWDQVFAGYASTTDWPACDYWRELMDHAPAAKLILTVRDAEGWFRSTQNTIFSSLNTRMAHDPSAIGRTMRAIGTRNFNGRIDDRDGCIAAYERHIATVQREVPAERLLTYNVAEGWAPLCAFLGVAVPEAPFPAVNSTDEFRQRAATMLEQGGGH